MARTIYFFGTAPELAASDYSAADQAAMTTATPLAWQACPAATKTIESKTKQQGARILVNDVNTSEIGATPFDFVGQIIETSSTRTNYVMGIAGDVVITDDGA